MHGSALRATLRAATSYALAFLGLLVADGCEERSSKIRQIEETSSANGDDNPQVEGPETPSANGDENPYETEQNLANFASASADASVTSDASSDAPLDAAASASAVPTTLKLSTIPPAKSQTYALLIASFDPAITGHDTRVSDAASDLSDIDVFLVDRTTNVWEISDLDLDRLNRASRLLYKRLCTLDRVYVVTSKKSPDYTIQKLSFGGSQKCK